jgi:hypothetical protein
MNVRKDVLEGGFSGAVVVGFADANPLVPGCADKVTAHAFTTPTTASAARGTA